MFNINTYTRIHISAIQILTIRLALHKVYWLMWMHVDTFGYTTTE